MSVELPSSRKRSSSFCFHPDSPRPTKVPRMGSLRRSESVLLLPPMHYAHPASALVNNHPAPTAPLPLPYYRTLQYYKEQRMRRKGSFNSEITIRTVPPVPLSAPPVPQQPKQIQPNPYAPKATPRSAPCAAQPKASRKPNTCAATTKRPTPTPKAPSQIILPSIASPITTIRTQRSSSPLSPTPRTIPGRPVFPRSKAEPDLYKTAIKMRMLTTPEGQRILRLGPRLALSIMEATKDIMKVTQDLECLVQDVERRDRDRDNDIVMADATGTTNTLCGSVAPPVLTTSWVVVKGEDWEMVDCAT